MRTAYGAVDDADFAVKSVGYDPMLWDASVYDGLPVLQLYGTNDTTVEPGPHAIAWGQKYAAPLSNLEWFAFDVREGGDHSSGNGSYLQVDAMTQFLTRARVGSWPSWTPIAPSVPEEPGFLYKVLGAYYLINGKRHRISRPPILV